MFVRYRENAKTAERIEQPFGMTSGPWIQGIVY